MDKPMTWMVGGLAAALAMGCSRDAGTKTEQANVQIAVSALRLAGIVEATYTIAVYNGAGALVWQKTGLASSRFGTGAGDLVYVGPCDASSNDNRVELTLESLSDGSVLTADEWQNPTAGGPLVQTVTCLPNRDASVAFDLTVMRDAAQGFFDMVVQFDDIFCSAKLDCADEGGHDLELLHDPESGERRTTIVLALACTTGAGTPTYLHLDDVHIGCAEDASYWFDPSRGPGNIPGRPPAFFRAATYRGREQLTGYDKCYWNMAIGVNEGPDTRNCVLTTKGTASGGPLEGGRTREGAVYPYILWSVPLTGGDGQVMCGRHPLNGPGSLVTTEYTPTSGLPFQYPLSCETQTIDSPPRALCGGTIVGLSDAVAVKRTAAGISVAVGTQESPPYELGDDRDIGGCCLNPCCTMPGSASE